MFKFPKSLFKTFTLGKSKRYIVELRYERSSVRDVISLTFLLGSKHEIYGRGFDLSLLILGQLFGIAIYDQSKLVDPVEFTPEA